MPFERAYTPSAVSFPKTQGVVTVAPIHEISEGVPSTDLVMSIAVGMSILSVPPNTSLLKNVIRIVADRVEVEDLPPPTIDLSRGIQISQQMASLLREYTVQADNERRWKLCGTLALSLCELAPPYHPSYFSAAMGYFGLKRYEDAKTIQLLGPQTQWESTTAHHSMACIELKLGNEDAAMKYVKSAIHIDPDVRATMLKDSDLQAIWSRIKNEA